jgi:adenylosuccinate lyase
MKAGAVVKGEGKANDLMDRIANDTAFTAIHSKLKTMIDPQLFVGRAPQQVEEFISDEVDPILEAHKELLNVENVDHIDV